MSSNFDLAEPPTPARALHIFGSQLDERDDAASLEALQAIRAAFDRDQLTLGRVLARGLRSLGKTVADSPFVDHRDAGRALIASGNLRSRKEGQFCGGVSTQETELTPAQLQWLLILLRRAGLPTLEAS